MIKLLIAENMRYVRNMPYIHSVLRTNFVNLIKMLFITAADDIFFFFFFFSEKVSFGFFSWTQTIPWHAKPYFLWKIIIVKNTMSFAAILISSFKVLKMFKRQQKTYRTFLGEDAAVEGTDTGRSASVCAQEVVGSVIIYCL